jgi:hypothetical protein
MGCGSQESLGTVLSRRSTTEQLLDALSVRQTPGTMQSAVFALLDFGVYAVQMGWAEEVHVYKSDVPAKNPPKAITVYTMRSTPS